jgi:hypothetical protein
MGNRRFTCWPVVYTTTAGRWRMRVDRERAQCAVIEPGSRLGHVAQKRDRVRGQSNRNVSDSFGR